MSLGIQRAHNAHFDSISVTVWMLYVGEKL